jgi:hypothetical protein
MEEIHGCPFKIEISHEMLAILIRLLDDLLGPHLPKRGHIVKPSRSFALVPAHGLEPRFTASKADVVRRRGIMRKMKPAASLFAESEFVRLFAVTGHSNP